jgi:hypothetical protein
MKEPFDTLARLAYEHAVKALLGTKRGTGTDPGTELISSFVLIKPDGKWDVIATPWKNGEEKREAVFAVCIHILAEKATAYSFTSEVWTAKQAPEQPYKQPRLRDDRREAVICLSGDANERHFFIWEIERDAELVCTGLKELEPPVGFESWIADSLERAIKLAAQDKDGKLAAKLKEMETIKKHA